MPALTPDAADCAIKAHRTAFERHIRANLREAGLPAPKPEYLDAFLKHPLLQKAIVLGDSISDPAQRSASVQLGDQHLLTVLAYVHGACEAFNELAVAAKASKSPLNEDAVKVLGKLIAKHKRQTK